MDKPQRMNFIEVGHVKKTSKVAIRDLVNYLKRKERLEKQYSSSNITFP